MVLKAWCPKCLAFSEKPHPLHPQPTPLQGCAVSEEGGACKLKYVWLQGEGQLAGWKKVFQCVSAMLAQKITLDP